MKTFRNLTAALAGLAITTSASAVVNSITTTAPGRTLTSATITRSGTAYTYSAAQLIDVNMTAFNGGRAVLLLPDGGSVPAPGSRASLIEDDRIDTGVINPDVGNNSVTIQFASPVFNSSGEDIILFEFDPTGEGNDTLAVLINGISQNISASSLLTGNIAADVYQNSVAADINSLAALESATFSKNSDTSQAIWAYSIDLSLFNIPFGASVTGFQFGAGSSTQIIDPVFIAGLPPVIPEPASALLLLVGGAGLLRRRRRVS